jgi:hypothetical protein
MNEWTNERTNFGHQPQHQITDVSAIELRLKGWGGGDSCKSEFYVYKTFEFKIIHNWSQKLVQKFKIS